MTENTECPHTQDVQKYLDVSLKEWAQGSCNSCRAVGPNFWLCLEAKCGYIGCGEVAADHSSEHAERYNHPVAINLKTMRSWCSSCDQEVFPNAIVNERMSRLVRTRQVEEVIHETVVQQDIIRYTSLPLRSTPVTEGVDEFLQNPGNVRGLAGLRNLGNTCYLNSGIQSLSNCPPFTHFFLECDSSVTTKKKPYIAKVYQRLMLDMWGKRRRNCITPHSLVLNLKLISPTFKEDNKQQDAQEFLRCFMDSLHEELKEPITCEEDSDEEDKINTRADSPSPDRICVGRQDESENDVGSFSDGEIPLRNSRETSFKRHTRHRTISASGVEVRDSGSDNNEEQDGSPEADQIKNETNTGDRRAQMHGNISHDVARPKDVRAKKRRPVKYRSIVSDVFDGKILSSVQCQTCLTESRCKETFQDISLPIPGKEDLIRIQGIGKLNVASCSNSSDGRSWWNWLTGIVYGVSNWLYGPHITLDDCLSAFFSADELKGDNMYSCEKCAKLRNGVKFSQVQELPEVLCIHLKRFRHDSFNSYSSKINNYVAFPMENLDMSRYVAEASASKCKNYDLVSVICHHGTAGGGHYTAYAQNWLNTQWYEFDDTYVTEVEDIAVMNAEAYVLFYKKHSTKALEQRQTVSELCEQQEPSLIQFYISLQWLTKFNTFVEPGPITNYDFLCKHKAVPPHKANDINKLFVKVSQPVWEFLHEKFGGGPVVNHLLLHPCTDCQLEIEQLSRRRTEELTTFIKLHADFNSSSSTNCNFCYISLIWFNQWEAFVKAKEHDPPGPIDNKPITMFKDGHAFCRPGRGSAQISEETWRYLHSIYDGGPELIHYTTRASITDVPTNRQDRDVESGENDEEEMSA